MLNRYKLLSALVACLAGCPALCAQALPSLLVSSDAAAMGTALSTAGKSGGAYALGSNVASMAYMEGTMAADVSFGLWQPSYAANKVLGLGAACKINKSLSLGLQAKYFGQQAYDVVTENGTVKGSFTPKDLYVGVGAAYALADFISVGITAKVTSSSLSEDASATAIGFDAGVFLKRDGLSGGISLNNLGGKVSYGDRKYSQPSMVKVGAAYRLGEADGHSVTGSLEADYLFAGAFAAGLGAEYSLKEILYVRCGYHYGAADKGLPSFASVGLGVKFAGVQLNAAYLLASETLGGSLTIGLGYSF